MRFITVSLIRLWANDTKRLLKKTRGRIIPDSKQTCRIIQAQRCFIQDQNNAASSFDKQALHYCCLTATALFPPPPRASIRLGEDRWPHLRQLLCRVSLLHLKSAITCFWFPVKPGDVVFIIFIRSKLQPGSTFCLFVCLLISACVWTRREGLFVCALPSFSHLSIRCIHICRLVCVLKHPPLLCGTLHPVQGCRLFGLMCSRLGNRDLFLARQGESFGFA